MTAPEDRGIRRRSTKEQCLYPRVSAFRVLKTTEGLQFTLLNENLLESKHVFLTVEVKSVAPI